jgi:MarR family transcriptional regulator for hemolysin
MDLLRNFGFVLKDISRLYSLNFERHAAELNMTLVQCKVLSYLQRNEGISQVRLAFLTDTGPMTLGRILDRMEGDGLIERRPDPADRRARRLFLQAPALQVLREIWQHSDRARAKALAGLSAADRAQLMSLLERIHSNLDALIPNAADTAGAAPTKPRRRAALHAAAQKS